MTSNLAQRRLELDPQFRAQVQYYVGYDSDGKPNPIPDPLPPYLYYAVNDIIALKASSNLLESVLTERSKENARLHAENARLRADNTRLTEDVEIFREIIDDQTREIQEYKEELESKNASKKRLRYAKD